MDLTPKQQEAVALCIDASKRLVAVTGSAGTGKTTILKHTIDELKERGATSALCAPTGKAAKRIKESTLNEASTVHRLLEFPAPGEVDPETGKAMATGYPKRNKYSPLPHDFVFVDEAAMINQDIFRFLVDALKPGACIRLFGDVNQLPPIEENKANQEKLSPFKDCLLRRPHVVLDVVHRQADTSGVLFNAERLLRGLPPMKRDDFFVEYTETPVDSVLQLCKQIDFRALDNQIISPTNQGWVGCAQLNQKVQLVVNPQPDPSKWVRVPRHPWDKDRDYLNIALNDKVVVTKNNYDLNIYNGETGVATEFDPEDGSFVIDFGDREVWIPPILQIEGRAQHIDPRKDIDLAYVLTTHKCQGSEFDTIAYVMNRSRSYNLNRNNFYTAITRARKNVHIISDRASLMKSLVRKEA